MTTKTIILVVTITLVQAQLNGEFWWLNEKLDKYRKVRPSTPKIEDLMDWETDESVKIVFRDDNVLNGPVNNAQGKIKKENSGIPFKKIALNQNRKLKKTTEKVLLNDKKENEDKFVFTFPGSINFEMNVNNTNYTTNASNIMSNNMYEFVNENKLNVSETKIYKDEGTQSICSFLLRSECIISGGTIYYFNYERNNPKGGNEKICCIIPLPSATKPYDYRIYFPDMVTKRPKKRSKRADNNENIALNQRQFLLKQKFSSANRRKSSPTTATKIVTPSDDYSDPYWNIKNNHKIVTEQHDYYSESDEHDYAAELPRPGLVGLYSDHAKSPSSWTYNSGGSNTNGYGDTFDYDDNDGEEEWFGYSTIDPRKDVKMQKQKPKPIKSPTSSAITYNAESHTINFQSNPDFHVLQGFKLLNVVQNKSRLFTKNTKSSTESPEPDDSRETSVLLDSFEEGEEFYEEDQLFGGCGQSNTINERDKEAGEASNGSHPWAALVVLTKRRQNILCYATLIHPRAAITVADCVDGTAPKDITVITGLWNLNDRSTSRNRVATVHVHPRYKPGEVDNNLAVLYWMRPLRMGLNVQPACLGEPHVGDECKFFGWGGLNNGIQPKSKWQRASIKPCESRIRLNKRGARHTDAFCAAVTRTIVTGMGGSLICEVDGHSSLVGVVVSRENGYKLTPVREFAMKSHELLRD